MLLKLLRKLLSPPRVRRRSVSSGEHLENRVMLATSVTRDTVNSVVTIVGGSENNAYVISLSGNTYRITDTSGNAVSVSGIPGGATSQPSTNVITINAAHGGGLGFNRFEINGNGGDDTITISGLRSQEGLTILNDAGEGTDTVHINASLGTSAQKITGNVINIAAEQINLGADIWTSNLGVTLNGPVSLTAGVQVNSGTGSITFGNTLNGAQALTVSGGAVQFSGSVGATTALTGITVTGSTSVQFSGNVTVNTGNIDIQTDSFTYGGSSITGTGVLEITRNSSGTQSFDNSFLSKVQPGFTQLRLGDSLTTTLTFANDGDSTPTGNANLQSPTLGTANAIVVAETLNQSAALELKFGTSLTFSGIGALVGTGAVTLTATGTSTEVVGNIGTQGIVNPWGAFALTANAGTGTLDFKGAVGSSLASFSANAGTLVFSSPAAIRAAGAVTLTATQITLGGGVLSDTADITLNGSVNLARHAVLRACGGRTITVNGNVSSSTGKNLTVRGDGSLANVLFQGSITGVGNLVIDSNKTSLTDNVRLGQVSAQSIQVRGQTVNLHGDLTAAAKSVQITGAIQLQTNLQITTAGSRNAVRLEGSMDGAYSLSLNAGAGKVAISGAVGATTPLAALTVVGTGRMSISHDIVVSGSVSWTILEGTTTGDSLFLGAGKSITANSILINVADRFLNRNGGQTGLNAATVSITEGGTP